MGDFGVGFKNVGVGIFFRKCIFDFNCSKGQIFRKVFREKFIKFIEGFCLVSGLYIRDEFEGFWRSSEFGFYKFLLIL